MIDEEIYNDYEGMDDEELLAFIVSSEQIRNLTQRQGWAEITSRLQKNLAGHMAVLQNTGSTIDAIRAAQGASQEITAILFLAPQLGEQIKQAQGELDRRRQGQ